MLQSFLSFCKVTHPRRTDAQPFPTLTCSMLCAGGSQGALTWAKESQDRTSTSSSCSRVHNGSKSWPAYSRQSKCVTLTILIELIRLYSGCVQNKLVIWNGKLAFPDEAGLELKGCYICDLHFETVAKFVLLQAHLMNCSSEWFNCASCISIFR